MGTQTYRENDKGRPVLPSDMYKKAKRCTSCGKLKLIDNFYKHSGVRGYWSKCKECVKKQRIKKNGYGGS